MYSGNGLDLEKLLDKMHISPQYSPDWHEVRDVYSCYSWLIDPTAQIVRLNDNDEVVERFCTGFMIGTTSFLTAGHCFDCQPLFAEHGATNIGLAFNYQLSESDSKETEPVAIYRAKGIKENGRCLDNSLDYAVLETTCTPYQRFGKVKLSSHLGTNPNYAITQHPNGTVKKIGFGTLLAKSKNGLFAHNIDTMPGSSGAPLGKLSTKKAVGVHIRAGNNSENVNYAVSVETIAQDSEYIARQVNCKR